MRNISGVIEASIGNGSKILTTGAHLSQYQRFCSWIFVKEVHASYVPMQKGRRGKELHFEGFSSCWRWKLIGMKKERTLRWAESGGRRAQSTWHVDCRKVPKLWHNHPVMLVFLNSTGHNVPILGAVHSDAVHTPCSLLRFILHCLVNAGETWLFHPGVLHYLGFCADSLQGYKGKHAGCTCRPKSIFLK